MLIEYANASAALRIVTISFHDWGRQPTLINAKEFSSRWRPRHEAVWACRVPLFCVEIWRALSSSICYGVFINISDNDIIPSQRPLARSFYYASVGQYWCGLQAWRFEANMISSRFANSSRQHARIIAGLDAHNHHARGSPLLTSEYFADCLWAGWRRRDDFDVFSFALLGDDFRFKMAHFVDRIIDAYSITRWSVSSLSPANCSSLRRV